MKRLQINSIKAETSVYKRFPTLDIAQRYNMRVEQFTLPCNLNPQFEEEIYRLERRGRTGSGVLVAGPANLTKDHFKVPYPEFIPKNCRNVKDLIWQINNHLNIFFSQLRSGKIEAFDDEKECEDHHAEWKAETPAGDWRDKYFDAKKPGIQATLQPNGSIGFVFDVFAQAFLVLRLTDFGKRVLGWPNRYIAPTDTGSANNYYDEQKDEVLNGPADNQTWVQLDNSLFHHDTYHDEVIVYTSLPVTTTVRCENNTINLKSYLMTYRYPDSKHTLSYTGQLSEYQNKKHTRLIFENNQKTHNEFILTGSELQNFKIHVKLRRRVYDHVTDKFIYEEIDYPCDGRIWTLMLAVQNV